MQPEAPDEAARLGVSLSLVLTFPSPSLPHQCLGVSFCGWMFPCPGVCGWQEFYWEKQLMTQYELYTRRKVLGASDTAVSWS